MSLPEPVYKPCPECGDPLLQSTEVCPRCSFRLRPRAHWTLDDAQRAQPYLIACPYCIEPLASTAAADEPAALPATCPHCGGDPSRDAPLEFATRHWDLAPTKACAHCGARIHALATVCFACRQRQPEPGGGRGGGGGGGGGSRVATADVDNELRLHPRRRGRMAALVGSVAIVGVAIAMLVARSRGNGLTPDMRAAIRARVDRVRTIPWDTEPPPAAPALPADVTLAEDPGGNTLVVFYDDRATIDDPRVPDREDHFTDALLLRQCATAVADPAGFDALSERFAAHEIERRLRQCATAKYLLGVRLTVDVPLSERPGFTDTVLLPTSVAHVWTVSHWECSGRLVLVRIADGAAPGGGEVIARDVRFDAPRIAGMGEAEAIRAALVDQLAHWR